MGNKLQDNRREIADFINEYVKKRPSKNVMTKAEISKLIKDNEISEYVMFQPSDCCYDLTNAANIKTFETDIHLFECLARDKYKILGEVDNYSGPIRRNIKATGQTVIVGEWLDGTPKIWQECEWLPLADYQNKRMK